MFGESAGPVVQDAVQNQALIEAGEREAAAQADQIGAGEGEHAARRGSSDGEGEAAGESGGAAEQGGAAAEHEHQQ
jgi:hypothetical protein